MTTHSEKGVATSALLRYVQAELIPGRGRAEQRLVKLAVRQLGDRQLGAPYAPCVQNSQAQIDGRACESDNPRFPGHFFQWCGHIISPFELKVRFADNVGLKGTPM